MTAKKTVKLAPKPKRSPQMQPENYGYPISLARDGKNVLVISGCRCLTFAEARSHWTARAKRRGMCTESGEHGPACLQFSRARARKMVKLLPLLAQRARRYGWTAKS